MVLLDIYTWGKSGDHRESRAGAGRPVGVDGLDVESIQLSFRQAGHNQRLRCPHGLSVDIDRGEVARLVLEPDLVAQHFGTTVIHGRRPQDTHLVHRVGVGSGVSFDRRRR